MYSFDDGGGRSLTLRPEGTAPVCRAYVEHGMHKLAAPVRLYYLSSFFRAERPQAGRYRQFWQLGVEALGSEDPALDAETIVLLATFLERIGVAGLRLRLSSLGSPASRAAYREDLARYLRANADRLAPVVRERIELNPLRAFDSDDPGTREVMAGAPRLLDRLDARRRRAFRARCASCSTAPAVAYEIDSDARPRARLLHAHAVRVHQRRARRAVRRWPGEGATTVWSSSSAVRRRRHRLGRRDRADHARL